MTPAKRFYANVGVVEAEEGWAVTLDGRPVRTPARAVLAAPTRALAELVAREWDDQGETISPEAMPATRLVNIALDRAPAARAALAEEIVRYASTDLVCHIEPDEQGLRARQEGGWTPLRAWAEEALGLRLVPVEGVVAAPQPEASLAAARRAALALDDLRLTALAHATALLGSAVLALALLHGRLDAEGAFALSRLDEVWQAERWGEDAEAAARARLLAADLAAVEAVLKALQS